LRRVWNTCLWSWQGWAAAWASEKTLRQWTIVNALSVGLSFCVDLSPAERAVIWGFGLLILAAELMNTGLEEVVDYISTATDPRAKKGQGLWQRRCRAYGPCRGGGVVGGADRLGCYGPAKKSAP
jgi:diacylglycerol kinase (ATP)